MDDIRNAYEGDESPPTSLGYLAGVHVIHGFARGNLYFRFEWARVDPWMYNRREHKPGNNGFFFEAMLNCTHIGFFRPHIQVRTG